jgi:hypothetical protein
MELWMSWLFAAHCETAFCSHSDTKISGLKRVETVEDDVMYIIIYTLKNQYAVFENYNRTDYVDI